MLLIRWSTVKSFHLVKIKMVFRYLMFKLKETLKFLDFFMRIVNQVVTIYYVNIVPREVLGPTLHVKIVQGIMHSFVLFVNPGDIFDIRVMKYKLFKIGIHITLIPRLKEIIENISHALIYLRMLPPFTVSQTGYMLLIRSSTVKSLHIVKLKMVFRYLMFKLQETFKFFFTSSWGLSTKLSPSTTWIWFSGKYLIQHCMWR